MGESAVSRSSRIMAERYRNGERMASVFVESAVNQVVSKRMVKHQQMQWTQRGALLLQIRTRVLNEEWETRSGAGIPPSGHKPNSNQSRKLPDHQEPRNRMLSDIVKRNRATSCLRILSVL